MSSIEMVGGPADGQFLNWPETGGMVYVVGLSLKTTDELERPHKATDPVQVPESIEYEYMIRGDKAHFTNRTFPLGTHVR